MIAPSVFHVCNWRLTYMPTGFIRKEEKKATAVVIKDILPNSEGGNNVVTILSVASINIKCVIRPNKINNMANFSGPSLLLLNPF